MKRGNTIRLATRGSALALWQARRTVDLLCAVDADLHVEIVTVVTTADRKAEQPLREFGDKALFVKEIEEAILAGRADAGVHSLKDLPGDLPAGLCLGCVLERDDPRDALFSRSGETLAKLPAGAAVATASLRRAGQVLAMRPDVEIVQVRGNVDTRLRKLREGQFDAIVMAQAGVRRLGLDAGAAQVFEVHEFVPAVAQGAIGLEVPVESPFSALWQQVDQVQTHRTVDAEREFARAIGADCKSPVACHCTIARGRAELVALACSAEGSGVLRVEKMGAEEDAVALAREAAADLLNRGARELFAAK